MSDIEKAEKQLEQAKERLKRAKQKARSAERKKDTRRKIIIGGILMAECRKHPQTAETVKRWVSRLNDRDRALFDGFNWTTEGEGGHE